MRCHVWVCGCVGVLLASVSGAAEAPQPLTLAEAIAHALRTSPRLEAARAGVAAARAQERAAKAQGRPNVDLNLRGVEQGPEVSLSLPKQKAQPGQPPPKSISLPGGGVFQPAFEFDSSLQATVPLYTGGRVSAAKRAARASERAALLREQEEAQNLVLDVTSAYLDTLEAKRQAELTASLRELNTERLSVARVRQRAGVAIPLEVSQAEADLAQAVQQEIDASARVRQSGATLNTLVGRPPQEALVLAPLPNTDTAAPAPHTGPPTPESLQALGLERPDLRALREEVHRADANVDAARAQRRPMVSLTGNALRRIPETLLGGYAWSLAASLVQSLFDGGRSRAQIESARAGRSQADANLRESERRTSEQVEQARVALEAAEKRVETERRRVSAAAEAVEVARTRLRAGTVPPIEVTEAQTTLTRAQTDLLNARFEAARARVRLAFATGVAYPDTLPSLAEGATTVAQVGETVPATRKEEGRKKR